MYHFDTDSTYSQKKERVWEDTSRGWRPRIDTSPSRLLASCRKKVTVKKEKKAERPSSIMIYFP
jgi:hypothetical protein